MADSRFISITTILDDWLDFSQEEGKFDEQLILKLANDAANELIFTEQYEEKIVLLQVTNYKAQLPSDFKLVNQAAYNIEPGEPCSREELVSWTQKALDGTGCKLNIDLECPKCTTTTCSCSSPVISVDVNRIYEMAHPEMYSSYFDHFYKAGGTTGRGTQCFYHPHFYLMRRKSGTFYNTPYHIGDCLNIDVDSAVEYNIDLPNMIVNFQRGQVLLSYLGARLDERGFRLIPDDPRVFTAINRYIEERFAYAQYRKTRMGVDGQFWERADLKMTQAMRIAKNKLRQPQWDEFKVWLDHYWRPLIPDHQFEQNLGRFRPDRAVPTPKWKV